MTWRTFPYSCPYTNPFFLVLFNLVHESESPPFSFWLFPRTILIGPLLMMYGPAVSSSSPRFFLLADGTHPCWHLQVIKLRIFISLHCYHWDLKLRNAHASLIKILNCLKKAKYYHLVPKPPQHERSLFRLTLDFGFEILFLCIIDRSWTYLDDIDSSRQANSSQWI